MIYRDATSTAEAGQARPANRWFTDAPVLNRKVVLTGGAGALRAWAQQPDQKSRSSPSAPAPPSRKICRSRFRHEKLPLQARSPVAFGRKARWAARSCSTRSRWRFRGQAVARELHRRRNRPIPIDIRDRDIEPRSPTGPRKGIAEDLRLRLNVVNLEHGQPISLNWRSISCENAAQRNAGCVREARPR